MLSALLREKNTKNFVCQPTYGPNECGHLPGNLVPDNFIESLKELRTCARC